MLHYKHVISKALRYGPCVTRGSHSLTCHPHTNHILRHHRPLAGTHTKFPRASCTCCRCTWSSSSPLRQQRSPDGAACQTVICRQPSFPGCCTLCVEQSAWRSYICSVTAFIPATSQNILVLAIFSGRHRDTLVDLAIVLCY